MRRRNRFGVTRSDARDLERQLKEQIKERAAQFDPLLAEQLKTGGALAPKARGGSKAEAAGAEAAATARPVADGGAGEVLARPFEARIEASRLDGRPALVLDYAAARRGGVADLLWGPLLGMRDELREVSTKVSACVSACVSTCVSSKVSLAWHSSSTPRPTEALKHAVCLLTYFLARGGAGRARGSRLDAGDGRRAQLRPLRADEGRGLRADRERGRPGGAGAGAAPRQPAVACGARRGRAGMCGLCVCVCARVCLYADAWPRVVS